MQGAQPWREPNWLGSPIRVGRIVSGYPGNVASGGGKLATYRGKRDFARTPEPSGSPAPLPEPGGPARFVVQRHRARRLHYDFRLEIDGVLVSWAVPKGPTLDPAVRRAAFKSRTTRSSTSTSRASSRPASTAEATSSSGTRAPGRRTRPGIPPTRPPLWTPASCTSTSTARSCAAGSSSCAPGRQVRRLSGGQGKEEWLLLHKHDDDAVDGWDAEDHPRSVLSGRTNDEVQADPDRMWRSDLPAALAAVLLKPASEAVASEAVDPESLQALDGLGNQGTWHVFGRDLRVTNLDKVLFPARPGEEPVTKRDLLRYAAQIAPTAVPYLTNRALNMHRYPNGAQAKGFWHKELPVHRPQWLPRWTNPEADQGETQTYLVVDEPAALVWAANFGALEWHAWTSQIDEPHLPSYALVDLDPGGTTSWQDLLVLARLHRTAFEHLGVHAFPKVTGRRGIQIWIPIVRGPAFDETRAWVERLSKTVGTVGPRPRQLEVAGGRARRAGPARLHPERDQQDPGRSVQPAARAGRAGLRPHHLGRARRPRAATGRVHHPHHRFTPRGEGRPVRGSAPPGSAAAAALIAGTAVPDVRRPGHYGRAH